MRGSLFVLVRVSVRTCVHAAAVVEVAVAVAAVPLLRLLRLLLLLLAAAEYAQR